METVADVATLQVRDPAKLAFITQTTLSVDDTADIAAALKARFPKIHAPAHDDICYATTNRQAAVKAVAPKIDALLVIGAPNSSNSKRLVEVGSAAGCPYSMLIQRAPTSTGAPSPRPGPSASPPEPPRPKFSSTKSSTPSAPATRSRWTSSKPPSRTSNSKSAAS